MTPRPSLIGRVAHLAEPGKRRAIFGVLIAACAVLTLYPQKYRAAASLTPSDPSSLGLSGTLVQLGAGNSVFGNSVFGNQAAIEVSLKVAQSRNVRQTVAKRLDLEKKLGKSPEETFEWLDRNMSIRSLRGGIVQFELKQRDAEFARKVVEAYSEAVREELAIISRRQTSYKRQILEELVGKASDRLTKAQTAYDSFRLQTRYSQPQSSISAIGERIPMLEQMIKAKQVELNAQRQFATDDNMRVRQILAEISALQTQLNEARSTSPDEQNSVGRVVQESTEVDRLRRELDLSMILYESYKRFLQGTSVEDLTSSATVRILEPAYIDTARQYNLLPFALGALILLLGLAIEFYSLRPPLGDEKLA